MLSLKYNNEILENDLKNEIACLLGGDGHAVMVHQSSSAI